ncbi:hypothetical protein KIN20_030686 [Parelaphostrongylus tenuis]|uniref:Uncharacterized protein n=1 Tax=Parelaphostrongylus tenuis TaxID=148309 RepID=A0AAD5R433_PARTN|nr:hypothetical protein KIN20_030686 [Parelaphostrongylus tenuis]
MENEASFLFDNGLSTEVAMDRLVNVGKTSIHNWDLQKTSIGYRCSVDKVLCRNLLLTSILSAVFLVVGSVSTEDQASILELTILYVIFLLSVHYVQWRMSKWSLMEKKRKALEALDHVTKVFLYNIIYR